MHTHTPQIQQSINRSASNNNNPSNVNINNTNDTGPDGHLNTDLNNNTNPDDNYDLNHLFVNDLISNLDVSMSQSFSVVFDTANQRKKSDLPNLNNITQKHNQDVVIKFSIDISEKSDFVDHVEDCD